MMFQSSPAPKSRCNGLARHFLSLSLRFQSSPAPKSRCNRVQKGCTLSALRFNPHRLRRAGATGVVSLSALVSTVSILTGSEEPVQRTLRRGSKAFPKFQSSPAPKSRCNGLCFYGGLSSHGFNPHRLRRAGATYTPMHRSIDRPSFNPHRLRRAGATGLRCRAMDARRVSILTGSEEPVQPEWPTCRTVGHWPVSILTGSEEPVQH